MTATELLTNLMDKTRQITGLTEKIGVARLTELMDHFDLHVNPNLLSQSEWEIVPDPEWPMWSNTNVYQRLAPGTYTLSWRAKTTGSDTTVRVRILDLPTNRVADGTDNSGSFGGTAFPLTSSRASYTFTVPQDNYSYSVLVYGSAYNVNQTSTVQLYDCKLEVGDLATPLEKVGGVVKALLCVLFPVRGCAA